MNISKAHIRCPLVKDVRSEPRLHHVVSSAEEQRWWAPLTRREEDEDEVAIYNPDFVIEGRSFLSSPSVFR